MNPVLLGMTFRLRRKYDLRGVLLATAIYWPIFIFVLTSFIHFLSVLFDDDTADSGHLGVKVICWMYRVNHFCRMRQ